MYDRKYGDKLLNFEASGALYHSALVMQDDQTETYWAIMASKAIGGPMKGSELVELPLSTKTTWAEWVAKHPDTLVLHHKGTSHIESNPYDNYFQSDKTFRPVDRPDQRLPLKASVFAFTYGEKPFVVTHEKAEGGLVGKAGGQGIFFHRPKDSSFYRSTLAYRLADGDKPIRLKRKKGRWQAEGYGLLDPASGVFSESRLKLEPLVGIDTFWYIWFQYHPKTRIIR